MDKLDILKLLSFISILVIGLIFSFMPNYLNSCRKNEKLLDIANTFSGGLFLGISLLHLLPESQEKFYKLKIKFPLAFLICILIYCLILYVEKVVFDPNLIKEENEKVTEQYISKRIDFKIIPFSSESNKETEDFNNDDESESNFLKKKSLYKPFILLFALGFHALFEGIAVGILEEFDSVLSLTLVIVAHKWAEGLSFGISFIKLELTKCQINLLLTIYSIIGPSGVLLGWLLSIVANPFIQGIFLAASSGTFLYISCSEIIVEEFEKKKDKCIKFLFLLLGAIMSAILAYFE